MQNALIKYGPVLLAGLLAVALASDLARATWALLAPQLDVGANPPPATAVSFPAPRPRVDHANEIVARHLFGIATVDPAAAEGPIEAPETPLNLTLRGVVASAGSRGVGAVIADASGKDSFYLVGSEIPGGVMLREVHPDRVILERNGRFETLTLPRAALNGAQTGASPPSEERFGQPEGSPSGGSPEVGALLRGYREDLANNPDRMMGLVRTVPVVENGRQIGYRIAPGEDKSLLSRFGLQAGDIVASVNGIPLDSPVNGLELFHDLTNAQQLSLQVLRNGMPKTFVFQISE